MKRIRAFVYRLGYRPRIGSILHSPTLAWQYAANGFVDAMVAGWREAEQRRMQP